MRFTDVPKLPPSRFGFDNMMRQQCATPCYLDLASGQIAIERPWTLVGWSDEVDERLMAGREGQVCLMLFHPDDGELWQHYPLYDDEERLSAVFFTKGGA